MRGPVFNKHQLRNKVQQFKQQSQQFGNKFRHQANYWWGTTKEGAKQFFIPLAAFQLIRTVILPTPIDVILLLIIFAIIIGFLIDWV